MIAWSEAERVLAALAADPDLIARCRADVLALTEAGLGPDQVRALAGDSLRMMAAPAEGDGVAGAPSQGPQCTQAGCYTRERNCTSQYACSKTGPC